MEKLKLLHSSETFFLLFNCRSNIIIYIIKIGYEKALRINLWIPFETWFKRSLLWKQWADIFWGNVPVEASLIKWLLGRQCIKSAAFWYFFVNVSFSEVSLPFPSPSLLFFPSLPPPILSCPFCHCNFLWNPEIWNCVYRCHIVCNLLANGLGPDVCWFMRFILLQVKAFGFILLTLMSSCHPSSPACWGPNRFLFCIVCLPEF